MKRLTLAKKLKQFNVQSFIVLLHRFIALVAQLCIKGGSEPSSYSESRMPQMDSIQHLLHQ
jgi:hypothetical protein